MSTYGVICCRKTIRQRLKAGELGEVIAQDGQPAVDGLAARVLNRHVAVEVIDERAVERLLLLEQRRDDAADGGGEAAPEARLGLRCAPRFPSAC